MSDPVEVTMDYLLGLLGPDICPTSIQSKTIIRPLVKYPMPKSTSPSLIGDTSGDGNFSFDVESPAPLPVPMRKGLSPGRDCRGGVAAKVKGIGSVFEEDDSSA